MSQQSSTKKLKAQLCEKEELIAALTERLELAADQLDRYRRNGSDSTSRTSFSPGSSQKSEERTLLLEELQQMLAGREEAESKVTLDQISTQIRELHSLVENKKPVTNDSSRKTKLEEKSAEQTSEGTLSAWAAMKANILGDDVESLSEDDPQPVDESNDSVEDQQEEVATVPEITWASLTLPEDIDVEQADFDTLSQAIADRDQYISYLVQKLRIAETAELPKDWESVDAPKEMQQRLSQLATRLEETLRLSEIEISMERARLSRENTRLQLVEQKVAKALETMGINLDEEEIDWDDFEESNTDQGSRWLRLLGMGSDE